MKEWGIAGRLKDLKDARDLSDRAICEGRATEYRRTTWNVVKRTTYMKA